MRRLSVKRVYEPANESDGLRVLVDRMWPRGLSREKAQVDHWLKEVAPSAQLRRWFGHDPQRWQAFRERYFAELDAHPEAVEELRRLVRKAPATLLFAARDERHNNAAALADYLRMKK